MSPASHRGRTVESVVFTTCIPRPMRVLLALHWVITLHAFLCGSTLIPAGCNRWDRSEATSCASYARTCIQPTSQPQHAQQAPQVLSSALWSVLGGSPD